MTDHFTGKSLPNAEFGYLDTDGPKTVTTRDLVQNRRIVIFAVPGAYTPTCTNAHMPGFVAHADELRAKGIDDIYCVTVNDIFVADAWANVTGAKEANVYVLCDLNSEFTKALGMAFDGPAVGLLARSKRYAMIVNEGIIEKFEEEEQPGQCQLTSAENLLSLLA